MVAVAQLVESRIVIPVVAGSSPVGHPTSHAVSPVSIQKIPCFGIGYSEYTGCKFNQNCLPVLIFSYLVVSLFFNVRSRSSIVLHVLWPASLPFLPPFFFMLWVRMLALLVVACISYAPVGATQKPGAFRLSSLSGFANT